MNSDLEPRTDSIFAFLHPNLSLSLSLSLKTKVTRIFEGHLMYLAYWVFGQRTELYEYSKVLGNAQFILLPFQPYKLIYAHMLAEVGKLTEAMK